MENLPSKSSVKHKLVLFISSLIFSIVILEILFRIPPFKFEPYPDQYIRDDILIIRPNPKFPEHDTKGFRNENVIYNPDIIALGDSQTYGNWVRKEEEWTKVLSKITGLKTYNMAIGGYGPGQELVLLDEAVELKPKAIIVAFYSGNDLFDAYSYVYQYNRLSSLKSTREGLINKMSALEKESPIVTNVTDWTRKKFFETPATYSRTYYLLIQNIKKYYYKIFNKPALIINSTQNISDSNDQFVLEAKDGAIYIPQEQVLALDTTDLRISEGLRITVDAFGEMKRKASERETKFFVLIIPTKYSVYEPFVSKNKYQVSDNYSRLIANEKEMLNKLKNSLEEKGINYIDSTPKLIESTLQEKPTYLSTTDKHINPRGHAIIAELVKKYIEENNLLSENN